MRNTHLDHQEHILKRAAVFAHFDKDNLVDDYVFYYLENIKSVSNNIIFVTTSKICQDDISKLRKICTNVITRDNIGYDFMSWKTGINSIEDIKQYDEIIICNDSTYGPFYSLDTIFDTMSSKDNDFWGITDNHAFAYHIQSYFVVFKKNIITSKAFKDFWTSIKIERTKEEVIKKNEVGLTQLLMSANFKPGIYIDSSYLFQFIQYKISAAFKKKPSEIINKLISRRGPLFNHKEANQTHFNWKDLIIKKRMPFIKIELLRDNPLDINIREYKDVITMHSNYDINLILKHLRRTRNRVM